MARDGRLPTRGSWIPGIERRSRVARRVCKAFGNPGKRLELVAWRFESGPPEKGNFRETFLKKGGCDDGKGKGIPPRFGNERLRGLTQGLVEGPVRELFMW